MTSVAEIAAAMKTLLTETARRMGRETGFVERASKLDGASFAQTVVLGWERNPAASLTDLVQTAASVGVQVSPQGLDQRFTRTAAVFLDALLQGAVNTLIGADPVARPVLQRFAAVLVQDSSTIPRPDTLAEIWQGCGDAVQHHLAALKVHVRLDLVRGTLEGPVLTHGRTQDRASALQAVPLPVGALFLADLGYFSLARLRDLADQHAFFLTRLLVQTKLFDVQGQPLALSSALAQTATPTLDQAVLLGRQERLPVRLLAVRVPPEVVDQRRRRLRADARRHGRTVSAAQLALLAWTLLVTNVPVDQLSLPEAVVLYRVRWQVEVLFKVWKNWGKVDDWRTAKDERILCELYAKLIGLLLAHWLIVASCWSYPDRSLVRALATVRAHSLLLAYALAGHFDLTHVLGLLHTTLAACPRLEHRTKHPATFQLLLELSDVP